MAPDAGEKLVLYDFKLTNNGDYFKNYTFTCPEFGLGPEGYVHECLNYTTNPISNAEDSWIHTPHYNRHFAENWWVLTIKIYVSFMPRFVLGFWSLLSTNLQKYQNIM